jgi:hypothetical protein
MPLSVRRAAAMLALALCAASPASGAGDAGTRSKILAAFAHVNSYRVTVLGSVRSVGVWVAPNKYQMTTEFAGQAVKTIIIGRDYWTFAGGRWQKAGTVSSNLDVDIAGVVRAAKADPSATFAALPDQTQDGKRVGTFGFSFKNGTVDTCNYDKATYRVTRCKADETTLLYSGYDDPANTVANPK